MNDFSVVVEFFPRFIRRCLGQSQLVLLSIVLGGVLHTYRAGKDFACCLIRAIPFGVYSFSFVEHLACADIFWLYYGASAIRCRCEERIFWPILKSRLVVPIIAFTSKITRLTRLRFFVAPFRAIPQGKLKHVKSVVLSKVQMYRSYLLPRGIWNSVLTQRM